MNEMVSTVDVLEWHKADGSLTLVTAHRSADPPIPIRRCARDTGCDTVITRDGKFVYFANRDTDFLYTFSADPKTGALTPIARSSSGGKTPRNFVLDPTERWMLVANQDSESAVFARDPHRQAGRGRQKRCLPHAHAHSVYVKSSEIANGILAMRLAERSKPGAPRT